MQASVNGRAAGCALSWATVFGLLLSIPASAEPAEGLPAQRWIPSFAITAGTLFQQETARVSSRILTTNVRLRPSDYGTDWAVTTYVGVNLEILSPTLKLPGSPRVFANGEFLPTFSPSLDIAKEGDPKGLSRPAIEFPPPDPLPVNCPYGYACYDENGLGGVGSRTTAEVKLPTVAARTGLSFPFRFLGRQLYVKPSVGWLRYKVGVDGRVIRGIKPGVPPTGSTYTPDTRTVFLEDQKSEWFDAIGPGVELEMDVYSAGPIESSLYLEGYGYKVVSDRRVKLQDNAFISGCDEGYASAFCPNLIPDAEYQGNWSFRADSWMYRAGIGLRFRWVGRR